jgi:Ice-binding-like
MGGRVDDGEVDHHGAGQGAERRLVHRVEKPVGAPQGHDALTQASASNVILAGGAQAKNVFWQTAGSVAIGTTAHSEGTILSKTLIAMNTGASTNGRLLAQTQVTLQKNVVTAPPP